VSGAASCQGVSPTRTERLTADWRRQRYKEQAQAGACRKKKSRVAHGFLLWLSRARGHDTPGEMRG